MKDLTVNNATIIASGQNNAGLIAVAPLGARINNVHLTGEVTIQGYRGVGGIVGNGFPQMDGCSVVAEGTITATYWGAGGILGFASDAGAKVTNSTVTSIGQGLTIRGELGGVGAVSGTPHGAKVNGAEITGVVIASNNNYYMGYVDAGGNVENVTVEDVAVKVNGEEIVGCDAVASIGTKGYFSLSSAFAAATDGQTITLLSNVKLAESLIIAADKDVVLDLNGKTISMEDASSATVAMIKNNGKLTINDSSANKDGKLSFKTTTPSMTNDYASNVISNYGEIIINAGTIENVSPSGSACYALDNYAGSTATINGGKLTAVKTTVRIFNWTNGDASKATLNVVGGEIISEDGYAININSGNTPSVALNVSGGTITTNDTDYNLAVYIINQNSAEKFTVNVSGGTFNGNFALNGKTSTTMSEDAIVISGGAFDGVICYETPTQGFVKGGTFKSDVTAYCADGFTCNANADGTYGVVVAPVAKIGSVEYASLQDAINAAQVGDTIVLLADVECAEKPVYEGDGVVNVDVNGHILVSSVKERIRNVVSADGLVPSNNIKFVSGFGWEVYSSYPSFVASDDNRFRVFPTLEQAANYDPATTHDVARIYAYENVKQTADVTLRASGLGTSSTICVDPGYDITWDLNGYTLLQETPTGNPLEACIRGTFTLDDTSVAKTGKWIAGACGTTTGGWYGAGGPAFYVLGAGHLILKGGTVSIARNTDSNGNNVVNSYLILMDSGSITVDGATLLMEDQTGIQAWSGNITVDSGTFDVSENCEYSIFMRGYYSAANLKVNVAVDGCLAAYEDNDAGIDFAVNAQGVVYCEGNGYVAPTLTAGLSALPTIDGNYMVGKAPTATVNNLGSTTVPAGDYVSYPSGGNTTDMPLSFVMQFLADESADEVQNSAFKEWYGDFVITFTGIANDSSFVADGCYLAGHYGSFGWVKIPVDGMTIEEGARYPVMLSALGGAQTYETICTSVKDFKCALYLTPEVLAANPNLEVKLELSVIDSSKGVDAATDALVAGENIYEVVNYEYEAIDFALYEGADVVIEEGTLTSFSNPNTITTNSITYKRALYDDLYWNPLYVPFQIPVSEFTALGLEVAYFNDVHSEDTDEDGVLNMFTEFVTIKSGTLRANYPYLFRRTSDASATAIDIKLDGATLYSTSAENQKTVTVSSAFVKFDVKGTYTQMSASDLNGGRVLGLEGDWGTLHEDYMLNPFRVYLNVTILDDSPVVTEMLRSIQFRVIDGDMEGATGVTSPDSVEGDDVVYDLQGRRVLEPKNGIYIVNGKKVIFK